MSTPRTDLERSPAARISRRVALATAAGGVAGLTLSQLPASPAHARVTGGRGRTELNLADFGAVGDGVADDSSAFNAAMDAIDEHGGGVLRLPPGVYRIAVGSTPARCVTT